MPGFILFHYYFDDKYTNKSISCKCIPFIFQRISLFSTNTILNV